MIAGLSGSLLSHDALTRTIPGALGHELDPRGAALVQRRLRTWHAGVRSNLGPASHARLVFDRLAVPLAEALGFQVMLSSSEDGRQIRGMLGAAGTPRAAVLVTGWDREPAGSWRDGVRHAIGAGLRWCLCFTGPQLRVIDARRTYSRRFIEFDLEAAIDEPGAFGVLWGLLRAEAFVPASSGRGPLLDRAVALSDEHRSAVRASLQEGVEDALVQLVRAFAAGASRGRRGTVDHRRLFDESLTVVYRILFLLFAEARSLVPQWHPTYRESYSLEALQPAIETVQKPPGLWETLQAMARLAHHGCQAGPLRVAPFNGRLFSPTHAPLADSLRLDDGAVRRVLLALTTRPAPSGRERIAYGDLGVEQLGGVYERVLDFEPVVDKSPSRQLTLVRGGRRKATGSFYTPRSLTEYLARRTLAPLVMNATADQILELRVLDPAMGSGAFLVAACRYLAGAYEAALVRDGAYAREDIGDAERAGFRRTIAQRCLFGVDINPMAVQLARLSLWLATLSRDRPLTFLDHHLRTGNSLVGASLDDLVRQPSTARGPRTRLPLLEIECADGPISAAVGPRRSLAIDDADTIQQVRSKERLLATLSGEDGPLARWKTVADLWCTPWFADDARRAQASEHRTFAALADEVLGRQAVLPPRVSRQLIDRARLVASREGFFHWPLEFPEVFYGDDGSALPGPGFDAVLGNPPWEMLRGDSGDDLSRRAASEASSRLTAFARGSGVYTHQGSGHANLYQLFVERAIALVRSGGRVGLILPTGFAADHGCAALRRFALDHCGFDTFLSFENRDGVFPIHRGLKFLVTAATKGARTSTLPVTCGIRSPEILDSMSDTGTSEGAVLVPRGVIEKMTGELTAVPEFRTPVDLAIAERIAFAFAPLGDPHGWNLRFGRELNVTDDRAAFVERGAGALPVIEGKQLQPFRVDLAASRFFIPDRAAAERLDASRTFGRARLAYRDVASASNRLTLIAAIVPSGVVTTHTLFCLKDRVDDDTQLFLCGVFNSFVANYLVRLRVGTHVTVAIIEQLPVPRPPRDSVPFRRIVRCAADLAVNPADVGAQATLQALAARLYGLGRQEFRHVIATFPLVPAVERQAAMEAFEDV